jgi:glycosyltransferase involved in cell wall biosynthesis
MSQEPTPADIPCLEGDPEYDVRWPWHEEKLPPGLTCVFRVKNEARNLPWVLPPMLEAVQHVVVVDNLSDDGTLEVAARVAAEVGASDRLTATTYPFRVSRAGAEHLATPPDSVHSLTHFYNWSFSHVRTGYSMKWDGDMVLTREGVGLLADLSWQLEDSNAVVAIPRHPLSIESESVAWIDLGFRFLEPWVYPMGPEFTFVKAFEWEVREFPSTSERIIAPEGLCVELKWLDADEFAHWTNLDDLDFSRAPRKAREIEVYRALKDGRGDRVPGLHRIEAPPGVHIVDHVTQTWLPQAPRPLVQRPGRIDV